ncbi:hypothetical protein MMC28_009340 [Mycoblastus sanguinarius]|nr:hypothetical protein [Mycoblastus sanguinarius]
MPFSLSEEILEENFDQLFVIQYKAISKDPVLKALFPGGLDPSARSQNIAGFKASLGWTRPHVAAAKVVDDVTGQICAFATMPMYDDNPFSGSKDSDIHLPQVDEKIRPFMEWLFNTKNSRRRDFKDLQVPGSYCYIQALATDPARQREGAATLLLKWAVDLVDKKGSRAMLEASDIAVKYGLYGKYGFRNVDAYYYVDNEHFPDMEGVHLVTMVRDAAER